jgi:SagB-type dehydrogenase family enzyme
MRRFAGYSEKSVRFTLGQLMEHGLLLSKYCRGFTQDVRIAKEWSAWLPHGSFHFSTKDAIYVDRSTRRSRRLKPILPETPQPKIFKTVTGAEKVLLPTPTLPKSEFVQVLLARKTHRRFSNQQLTLETISQLLSLVWGVKGYIHTHRFGRLLRKTSPSAGARHPGEVYLMALGIKHLKPGLYHYHPARHHLERLPQAASREKARLYCARQDFARNAAALFLMTAVFPRTMWKYHRPRAYRVVLLDAGHLCQTFCLVATWLGLAPFCTAAFKDTLIEKDLDIDGVRESVLYVAGVGALPTSARAR